MCRKSRLSSSLAPSTVSVVATYLSWLYLGILLLLPLHAFLTTWIGSSFGHLDAWRIWKEVLLFASFPAVVWLLWRHPGLRRQPVASESGRRRTADTGAAKEVGALVGYLPWLVIIYVVFGLLNGLLAWRLGGVSGSALVYGLFVDLRFPAFMMLAYTVALASPILRQYWRKAVLVPLVVVVGFGLLQLLLPADFLRHFGYGTETIPAVQYVDNKPEYPRLQSTLRGPNPLGAYLVAVLSIVAAFVLAKARRMAWLVLIAAGLLVMGYTYSRSAYMGIAISFGVLGWLVVRGTQWRRWAMVGLLVGVLAASGAVVALRDNDTVQNIAFHSDENSRSAESSNAGRARSLQSGLRDVVDNPLGSGVGTAGPASMRNTEAPPRIAENYYLQLGQEMGVVGFVLFVAVQAVVAYRLWLRRNYGLALGLLAGFCGLTLINMLSHAWADDTLGLLWWGLAGIALAYTPGRSAAGVE